MPRRSIWSARQRAALFDLSTEEAALLRHYTPSDTTSGIPGCSAGHNRWGSRGAMDRRLVYDSAMNLQLNSVTEPTRLWP